MKDRKHLYWVVGLVSISIILCGTLIWIKYNSWTVRFEMDDNTKEAIQSIDWESMNNCEKFKFEHSEYDLNCSGYYNLEGGFQISEPSLLTGKSKEVKK